MAHGPFHDPDFDFDSFRTLIQQWASAGAKRILIEWQTGPGPGIAWYPVGERKLTKTWHANVSPTSYNEEYADFLEYRLAPRLTEIARASNVDARVLCVDQQPIQVMRMRRREIEHAQKLLGAASAH